MKILVISAAYQPMQAGEATNTYLLCKHPAGRRLEVHVLTSRDNNPIYIRYTPSGAHAGRRTGITTDSCTRPTSGRCHLSRESAEQRFVSSMAAHGLPMIATNGQMLDRPFVHGENGFLCEPKDVNMVAQFMMQLIDRPALRDHLRAMIERFAHEWLLGTMRLPEH